MRNVLYILGLLSDEDVQWVAAAGERVSVPTGGVLIEEGGHPPALFLLLDGKLVVSVAGPPARDVAALGPGEILGEVSFVDSRPATATVRAAGPAVVLRIPADEVRDKLEQDDGFAARFYRAVAVFMAQRLRSMLVAGRGPAANPLSEHAEVADELSPQMLDELTLAGKRVEWLLARTRG